MEKKTKLLFICLGNICRSPAADGVMNHLVMTEGKEYDFEIDSAGIGSWHVGDLPDYRMRSTGMKRGYAFNHRARQIELNDFAHFDYIIGMDVENMNTLRRMKKQFLNSDESKGQECAELLCLADFLKHHQGQTTVPDPYYGQQRDFEFALDLIEDACGELLSQLLAGKSPSPTPPKGRGVC